MAETQCRFEWPIVHETTACALVASRVFEPFLERRRADNATSWGNRSNWHLGFYFATEDTRLWVPKRKANGLANDEDRVINFGHPRGQKALRILVLGYGIGLVAIAMSVMALVGIRW